MVLDDLAYPLHRAAFFNDVKTIASLLESEATMVLLSHNAPVSKKNAEGWSSLIEAISYGNREIITLMLRKLKAQSKDEILSRKPHLMKMLSEFGDFYLELKWDFHSWIPLLSKVLPSDLCKIYKRGTSLRLDTTLVDFNDRSFERGDISFIYNSGTDKKSSRFFVLDNRAKVYQQIRHEDIESDIEDEVDVLMSSDMVNVHMSTKPIIFERTREHLSADDVKKNKAFMKSLAAGTAVSEEDIKSVPHRKNLLTPAHDLVSWDDYINAPPKQGLCLGRPQVLKQSSKGFSVFVAMSDEFPLSINVLLNILEVVAPSKHFNKLREFCEARLPPGFPVKIEIPLLPTITAKVTFQKFMFRDDLTAKMFKVPTSYREDTTRFKDI